MSFLDWLTGANPVTQAAAAGSPVVPVPVGTAAVSEGALSELDPAAAAAFGVGSAGEHRVTRKEAKRVPSIRRGDNLVVGTIAGLPLVQRDPAGRPVANTLLTTLDPRTTPAWTLAQTVRDLFYGDGSENAVSWWRVTSRFATDYPATCEWVHRDRVTIELPTGERMGRVLVDGVEVPDRDMIRFDGLDGGLLADGAPIVRLALALIRAAKRTADDDWSGLILRLAEGADELTPEKIVEVLTAWETARQQRTTAYLNRAIEPHNVSLNAAERQLKELWDLCSSELARLMNMPASRTGAPQGSGMTYSNTESDRRDLVDTTLAFYMTPIVQRLSMGDVTPHDHRVSFNLTSYLRGTTTELVAAGAAAIAAGLTDAPEVRTDWLGLPPRTDLPAPAPAAVPAAPPAAPREDTTP